VFLRQGIESTVRHSHDWNECRLSYTGLYRLSVLPANTGAISGLIAVLDAKPTQLNRRAARKSGNETLHRGSTSSPESFVFSDRMGCVASIYT
jgi:hypothetical protein